MKIFKFNKRVEIDKSIGNLRIETFHYGNWIDGKNVTYSELHIWYDNDCEYCPCCWEDRSYEGECNDCGCRLARKGHEEASTFICMLPTWIKNALIKIKEHGNDNVEYY